MERRMVRIWRAGDQLPFEYVNMGFASGGYRRYGGDGRGVWCGEGRHTLKHVETDAAETVDVGMIDFGQEADFRRCHGVVVWEEEFEFEDSAWFGCG